MVETGGSSWHQTNRGVSIYFTVYVTLFFVVVILSKLLHDRPKLASFVPEAAMIILVGMIAGLIFDLLMNENQAVESMLSFSPTVFFVVLVSDFIKSFYISTLQLQNRLFKLVDSVCSTSTYQSVAPTHHF
jgi:flagellar biosynthesis protein FliQ